MNILELISKQHPQVRAECRDSTGRWAPLPDAPSLISKVIHERKEWQGWHRRTVRDTVRGLRLDPGTRLVVREAARHWPGFARGEGLFYAKKLGGAASALQVSWSEGGEAVRLAPSEVLDTVRVPPTRSGGADLVLEVLDGNSAPVFLGVHRLLDRKPLLAQCKGKGMEIGPGPKPQVLPAADVDVSYVEQATPDQWQALYGKDTKSPVDPTLWDRYVVGNADRVPASPGTLDFIFSSHVIEHLANPLGHLAYWATLLRPGGVVAAVIPDMEGCKDFVFRPSTAEELVGEWRSGDMDVKLRHYERWAAHRSTDRSAAEIMASGRSIHVHFFTPASMRQVLDQHARGLGFRSHQVISSANHKDFHVLLRK